MLVPTSEGNICKLRKHSGCWIIVKGNGVIQKLSFSVSYYEQKHKLNPYHDRSTSKKENYSCLQKQTSPSHDESLTISLTRENSMQPTKFTPPIIPATIHKHRESTARQP